MDLLRVLAHIVVGGQVESPGHLLDVLGSKQRPDVTLETHEPPSSVSRDHTNRRPLRWCATREVPGAKRCSGDERGEPVAEQTDEVEIVVGEVLAEDPADAGVPKVLQLLHDLVSHANHPAVRRL